MNAPVTRRSVLQAGGAALGAAVVPVGAAVALAAEAPATPRSTAVLLAFDPAAFIADLKAAGYGLAARRWVPPAPGGEAEPPSYVICPPKGRGFGAAYTAVMARWWDAMDACPDHVERVVDHVLDQGRRDAA